MSDSIQLFGIRIDRLTMASATQRILTWCGEPRGAACRYVVTPNVDHAVMLRHHAPLRAAYNDASLVVADGAPVVWASRFCRKGLPERVAGSDLVPQLFDLAADGACTTNPTAAPLRVFLLGAAPGVADEAACRIHEHWRGVSVVGTHSPPLGFERDSTENQRALAAVGAAEPDLLLVGLGAPKQELWVHAHRHQLRAKAALCIGATIDFLAGRKHRSPRWMRRVGLEWAHRMLSEPRRLTGRYARDAWIFPQLVWHEWCRREHA